jgi:predicted Zn-dependent peptidase
MLSIHRQNPISVTLAILLLGTSCSHAPTTDSSDTKPSPPAILETNLPPQGIPGKQVMPFVGSFKVNRYTFENGLRLLVVEDHSSPTFAYETWFRVGSYNEVTSYTGLAHLFEHMMFKGTKAYKEGEFDKILESAGVEGENAFTNRDYTAYIQELPKDKLDLIAKLESDRMVNLVVDDQSFKTEREVVQNERRFRNENSPDGTMYQELFNISFLKHPYHWPVIGYEEDLNRMTPQTAYDFYQTYYSPNHASIIVIGDVTPDLVYSTVRKYYGDLKPKEAAPHPIETEAPQTEVRRKDLRLNIQVEKLLIGYRAPGVLDDDAPSLAVLQTILSGGKSSRLQRALVDTGISSGVDSEDIDDKDPTLFIISTNLQVGHEAAEAEKVILDEISRLVLKGVDAQELERAKNKLEFGFYDGLDTNSERAHFLGHYEAIGGNFELGLKNQEKIKSVTVTDVQRVATKYLVASGRSVVTGLKKGEKK